MICDDIKCKQTKAHRYLSIAHFFIFCKGFLIFFVVAEKKAKRKAASIIKSFEMLFVPSAYK